MKDVFGIDTQIGGAWTLDGAVMSLGDFNDGLVVTSADVQYTRRSQKFSPLNQAKKYLVTGQADGMLVLGVIVGPSKQVIDFITKFADPCFIKDGNNLINLSPVGTNYQRCAQNDFQGVVFRMHGCLLNQIRVSVTQAGGTLTVVSAGLQMEFISLSMEAQNSATDVAPVAA